MNLQNEWYRCRHWIEAALAYNPGFETIEDVEARLNDGTYMLWPWFNSAAITEIEIGPRKRVICIRHAGGSKDELIHQITPHIENFGAEQGCESLDVTGRLGWMREGLKHGFRFSHVTMTKDLRQ